MDRVLVAAKAADLNGCKTELRAHFRATLAPALVEAVSALVDGGDATHALGCMKYFLQASSKVSIR